LWIKQICIRGAEGRAENGGEAMALPFLHKFRASWGRNKMTAQPQRENRHEWPLSLVGEAGPELLTFEIMGLGESAPRKAGIFIYARQRAGEWQALYIGETGDLSARLSFNEIAADALLSGATDIHVLKLAESVEERRAIADRLILTNRPPLNEEERTKLETAAAPRLVTKAKTTTRAA
jgi:hypothetical protein